MLVPAPLRPGDHVRVIAPSSPFDRALVLRGIGWLGQRYRVEFDRSLFAAEGFLAGSDARRLAELDAALESDAAAIVAARGGYGVTRIAHRANWKALADKPKWLVGFSDITALHVEVSRIGVASLHGHNIAGLGRGDDRARTQWVTALEQPETVRRFLGLTALHPGKSEGPLVGGNLSLLYACAAAGRLRFPRGSVLVIEEIGESSYRVDRMLTALQVSGALDAVSGVVVGTLTDCAAGRYGVTAEEVIRERLHALRVPVVTGLPVGHGAENAPLPLGFDALLDAGSGTLETRAPGRAEPR